MSKAPKEDLKAENIDWQNSFFWTLSVDIHIYKSMSLNWSRLMEGCDILTCSYIWDMGFMIIPTSASPKPQCQIHDYRDLVSQKGSTEHVCQHEYFNPVWGFHALFLTMFSCLLYIIYSCFLSALSVSFFFFSFSSIYWTPCWPLSTNNLYTSLVDIYPALSYLRSVALHFCRVKYVHSEEVSMCQ